jgi:hypothetical protein
MTSEPTPNTSIVTNPSGDKGLTTLVILIALLVSVQAFQAFQGFSTRAQSWEYQIVAPADNELPTELRTLGAAGWEIVSARRATSEVNGRTVGIYELIMRRPMQELASGALPQPPRP